MTIFNKKAAMFGLDARIALTIFGALSVISGASLYSAIQDAKVTAIINQVQELAKAEEQFYLDTGSSIPGNTGNLSVLTFENLLIDTGSFTDWNGPYIGMANTHSEFSDENGNRFWLRVGSAATSWGAATDIPGWTTTCPDLPCNLWVQVRVPSDPIADAIDLKIDGTADRENGNVRVRDIGVASSTLPNVFIKQRVFIGG